jgi:Na+-driven multidrug efflux pump
MGQAMLITSIGAVLNIILDPVLIGCLPWNGVYSAALATVISQLVQFLITVYYIKQYEDECLHIKGFGKLKISKTITTKILLIGLSGMVMQLLMFLRAVFLYRSVSADGTDRDLAVMGAAQRVLDLVFIVVWGISQAVNPLVGINYGAGKYGRVKKLLSCFWIWSTASCIVTEIIIVVFSEHILALFIEDRNLCIYGTPLLRTMYAGYFTYGIVMILITYLQIRGKALKALTYVALWQVGLLIPCSFILPSIVNIPNIKWICVPIADIFSAVILLLTKPKNVWIFRINGSIIRS